MLSFCNSIGERLFWRQYPVIGGSKGEGREIPPVHFFFICMKFLRKFCQNNRFRTPSFGWTQWRIQDFPQGGAPTPKIAIIFQIFAKNCMKMKEFGPPGGARVPGAPLRSANGTTPGESGSAISTSSNSY